MAWAGLLVQHRVVERRDDGLRVRLLAQHPANREPRRSVVPHRQPRTYRLALLVQHEAVHLVVVSEPHLVHLLRLGTDRHRHAVVLQRLPAPPRQRRLILRDRAQDPVHRLPALRHQQARPGGEGAGRVVVHLALRLQRCPGRRALPVHAVPACLRAQLPRPLQHHLVHHRLLPLHLRHVQPVGIGVGRRADAPPPARVLADHRPHQPRQALALVPVHPAVQAAHRRALLRRQPLQLLHAALLLQPADGDPRLRRPLPRQQLLDARLPVLLTVGRKVRLRRLAAQGPRPQQVPDLRLRRKARHRDLVAFAAVAAPTPLPTFSFVPSAIDLITDTETVFPGELRHHAGADVFLHHTPLPFLPASAS